MVGVGKGPGLGLGIRPARELGFAAAVDHKPQPVRRLLPDNHGVTVGDTRGPFHAHYVPFAGSWRFTRAPPVSSGSSVSVETGAVNQARKPRFAISQSPNHPSRRNRSIDAS